MSGDHDWLLTRWGIRNPDHTMATTWQGQTWIWDNRDDAERALGYFRAAAEKLGVTDWRGTIVRQLCTPWLSEHDNTDQLVDELTRWLEQQIGGEA